MTIQLIEDKPKRLPLFHSAFLEQDRSDAGEVWEEKYAPIYIGEEDLEDSEVPEHEGTEPWWGGDDGV